MDDADRAVAQMEVLDSARLRRLRPASRPVAGGADCNGCGQPIPRGRLAAMPGAELCVECQEKLERAMAR